MRPWLAYPRRGVDESVSRSPIPVPNPARQRDLCREQPPGVGLREGDFAMIENQRLPIDGSCSHDEDMIASPTTGIRVFRNQGGNISLGYAFERGDPIVISDSDARLLIGRLEYLIHDGGGDA